eukprot:snap_masked-scaffold_37-processed-gene-1.32-mRNA-1 protein AED:1.00 eAED:1.00 QI:0/0/0/0/1/1/2/0/338
MKTTKRRNLKSKIPKRYVNQINWKITKDELHLHVSTIQIEPEYRHNGFEHVVSLESTTKTIVMYGAISELKKECFLSIEEKLKMFSCIEYIRYVNSTAPFFILSTLTVIFLRNKVKNCYIEGLSLSQSSLKILKKHKDTLKVISFNYFSNEKDILYSLNGQIIYAKFFNLFSRKNLHNKLLPLSSKVSFLFNLDHIQKIEISYWAKLSVRELISLEKAKVLPSLKEAEISIDCFYVVNSAAKEYLISKMFYNFRNIEKLIYSFGVNDKSKIKLLPWFFTQMINSEVTSQTRNIFITSRIYSKEKWKIHNIYLKEFLTYLLFFLEKDTQKQGEVEQDNY